LFSTTIQIPSASAIGSPADWVIEFRDNNDQNPVSAGVPSPNNPAGTEYTVRFGRLIYDVTTGEDGCANPIIVNCPANIDVVNEPGLCGAYVDVPVPQYGIDFTDCFDATIVNDFTGTSDGTGFYPIGTTLVTWTVTDEQGNTTSCIQVIEVQDVENPTITCPADMVVETTPTLCGAVPGSTFPLGTTTVTYTVTDIYGNEVTCSFDITVEDKESPTLACPENITVFTTPGTCDAVAEWDIPGSLQVLRIHQVRLSRLVLQQLLTPP